MDMIAARIWPESLDLPIIEQALFERPERVCAAHEARTKLIHQVRPYLLLRPAINYPTRYEIIKNIFVFGNLFGN